MQNKPKLRFKEFNDEWREDKLCNLFLINAGGDIDSSHCSSEKTEKFCYPIYANALTNNGLYGYSDIYKVKGHTITVTGRGDVGHATPRKEPYYPIVRLLILRPQHNENVDFFASVINSTRIFLESTGVPQLTSPQLSKVKVSYPSTQEQNRIAEVLNKVDEVIAEREEEVKDLEKQKKGLMQKIFSQQLRFTDSNNNPYPDWEEKLIKDIATLTSSKRVHVADYVPKGIPFYRGKEISELRENKPISDILYISEETYEDFKGKYGVPQQNDILITAVGTLGNVWSISNSKPFYFKDGNLIWFRDVKENSKFMEYLFTHTEGKKRILDSAIGSNQKALTIVNLNKLRFKFPCLEEQQKIANILSKLDELIEEKKALLSDWQSFKKGLLQQMFV